ncbi:DUF4190 domain-containing protein [Cryobacterium sp. SO2]|uniref:DUF4190 domain-containing protein n=1 Tax=Cryobacterium sp. SO2 TaxID=1897060 RepID=UPI0023DBF1CD|nr:DUF4190 domain-containing protein [Cryobacterium sp. SO2]WEO78710.1 DUF4190 domain-containing protein [Cryobacterium sp. SO2]
MTDFPPPVPRDDYVAPASAPAPAYAPATASAVEGVQGTHPTFNKMAIWGFVIACVGLIVFGFLGALAAALSSTGLKAIRRTGERGKGLAIAGICIGIFDFIFYLVGRFFL